MGKIMQLADHQPFALLHPDRLRALCMLLDLPAPAAMQDAHVLVLGVRVGSNVLALASEYPQTQFTAVLSSDAQTAPFIAALKHLQLQNVHVLPVNEWLTQESDQQADYVLCHAYFSYLNEQEKQLLIERIAQNLSENGMAYIDYVLQPGWQSFATLQHLISQLTLNEDKLNYDSINQRLNLIYSILPENSLTSAILKHATSEMDWDYHPNLNGYPPLIPAHADTASSFMTLLHQAQLGYACDNHLEHYYHRQLPPEAKQLCGADYHARENMYDLIHQQASRASLVFPITQLIGFRLPEKDLIEQGLHHLHIVGQFDLDAQTNQWMCRHNPKVSISNNALNSIILKTLNHAYALDSTLAIADFLEDIAQTFQHIEGIEQHSKTLLTDLILTNAVYIRSESQNGFTHLDKMLDLHAWRLAHEPYLTPANKWLESLTESQISLLSTNS